MTWQGALIETSGLGFSMTKTGTLLAWFSDTLAPMREHQRHLQAKHHAR